MKPACVRLRWKVQIRTQSQAAAQGRGDTGWCRGREQHCPFSQHPRPSPPPTGHRLQLERGPQVPHCFTQVLRGKVCPARHLATPQTRGEQAGQPAWSAGRQGLSRSWSNQRVLADPCGRLYTPGTFPRPLPWSPPCPPQGRFQAAGRECLHGSPLCEVMAGVADAASGLAPLGISGWQAAQRGRGHPRDRPLWVPSSSLPCGAPSAPSPHLTQEITQITRDMQKALQWPHSDHSDDAAFY